MRSRASGVARLQAVPPRYGYTAFFLRLFRFYGRATPDARERIPTAPYVGPRRTRGIPTAPYAGPRHMRVHPEFRNLESSSSSCSSSVHWDFVTGKRPMELICSVSLIAKRSVFSRTRTTPQIRDLGSYAHRCTERRSSAHAQGRTTKAGCESRKKPGTPNGCSLGGLKAAISRMWSWKTRSVLLWLTHITVGRHDAARSRR
jgi:hypothetical protein